MRRRAVIIGFIAVLGLLYIVNNSYGNLSVGEKKELLEEYMQAVYAPETMEQFRKAKDESGIIFTENVKARFFVAYGTELTEADRRRICETYISHGAAKNQSDHRERFRVEAYLYNTKGAEPVHKVFMFFCDEEGKICDYSISNPKDY